MLVPKGTRKIKKKKKVLSTFKFCFYLTRGDIVAGPGFICLLSLKAFEFPTKVKFIFILFFLFFYFIFFFFFFLIGSFLKCNEFWRRRLPLALAFGFVAFCTAAFLCQSLAWLSFFSTVWCVRGS